MVQLFKSVGQESLQRWRSSTMIAHKRALKTWERKERF